MYSSVLEYSLRVRVPLTYKRSIATGASDEEEYWCSTTNPRKWLSTSSKGALCVCRERTCEQVTGISLRVAAEKLERAAPRTTYETGAWRQESVEHGG